ncbi:MAG: autotransporter-associated beta strand repeat-containing protein [Akkermansia sp.]|nr:autotransporter-associated beta strand repeat-containing protein [Akkermansia sp.]
MKLRLPHKFQAALMAALASVSITTLSTATAYAEESPLTFGDDLGDVMYIGDSITHGVYSGSYRWSLFQILADNGVAHNDLGPLTKNHDGGIAPGTMYAGQTFTNSHAAVYGSHAYEISDTAPANCPTSRNNTMWAAGSSGQTVIPEEYANTYIRNWLGLDANKRESRGGGAYTGDTFNPDTFMMMIGTNDILTDAASDIKNNYETAMASVLDKLLGATQSGDTFTFKEDADNTGSVVTIWKAMVEKNPNADIVFLSVPTLGSNHNNAGNANILNAVHTYNAALQQWCDKHGVTYVQSDTGIVDVSSATGVGVSTMYQGDQTHPSFQGDLIIAGNVAKAMGYAGRSVGLERSSATETNGVTWTTPITTDTTITAGVAAQVVEGVQFTPALGYTVDFSAVYGNGGTDEIWNNTDAFSITVGDGTHSGTLHLTEAYVKWDNQVLYSRDNSETGNFRIAYINNSVNAADNVNAGYYVWLGDQLIGEALGTGAAGFSGVKMQSTGADATVSTLSWTDAAYAPTAEGYVNDSAAFHLTQVNPNPNHDNPTKQGTRTDITWDPITNSDKYALPSGQSSEAATIYREISTTVGNNYTGAANAAYTGDIGMRYAGDTDLQANHSVISVLNFTVTGNVYMQLDNPNTVYKSWTNNNKTSVIASYGGNITGSYTVVYNAGIFDFAVRGGTYQNHSIGAGAYSYVNGGTFKAGVFGGGVDGTITGGTTVTVTGGDITGGVYGGGVGGTINGGTLVTITGGNIRGGVHGGGTAGTINNGTAVVIEGNLAHIEGDIDADTVTLQNVAPSEQHYTDGFDYYGGTIRADKVVLHHYTVEQMLASLETKSLVLSGGTATTIRDLTLTACEITAEDTSAVTLDGTLTLGNTATYSGNVTLTDGMTIKMVGGENTSASGAAQGGYRGGSWEVMKLAEGEETSNLTVHADTLVGAGMLQGSTFTYNGTTGLLSADGTDYSTYYLEGSITSVNLTTEQAAHAELQHVVLNAAAGTVTVDSGASNTLADITKQAGSALTLDVAGSLTLSGTITGTGGSIEKTGAGTVTLNGASRSGLSDSITVSAGSLVAAVDNSLTSGAVTVNENGTLVLKTYTNVPTISGTGTVQIDFGSGKDYQIHDKAFLDSFGGTVELVSGNLQIGNKANKFNNAKLKLSGGVLKGWGANFTHAIELAGGTLADAGANETYSGAISVTANSTVDASSGHTITLSGAITGSSKLTKAGAGALTLTGDNTSFAGDLDIKGGSVNFNNNMTAGTVYVAAASSAVTVAQGKTLDIAVFNNGWGLTTLTVNGVVNATDKFEYASGNSTQTINGSGVINAKHLVMGNDGKYVLDGTSGLRVNVGSGGITPTNVYGYTVTLKGGVTLGATDNWTGTVPMALGDGGAVIDTSNAETTENDGAGHNVTISGVLSGSGSLTKAGAGTLTLSGANTFTGGLSINGGTVKMGSTKALGQWNDSRLIQVNEGGVLDYNGVEADATGYRVTLNGGTLTNGSTGKGYGKRQVVTSLVLTANSTVDAAHEMGIIAGGYDPTSINMGGHTLEKTGASTFYLTNTTISNGGTIKVSQGSVDFNVTANDSQLGSLGANLELAGGNVGGNKVKLADDITVTASGNGGTLSAAVLTETHNLTLAGDADLTVSGAISGSGAIAKTGTGTATISGSTTGFTGGLAVDAGKLVVSHDITTSGLTGFGGTLDVQGALTVDTDELLLVPFKGTIAANSFTLSGSGLQGISNISRLGSSVQVNGGLLHLAEGTYDISGIAATASTTTAPTASGYGDMTADVQFIQKNGSGNFTHAESGLDIVYNGVHADTVSEDGIVHFEGTDYSTYYLKGEGDTLNLTAEQTSNPELQNVVVNASGSVSLGDTRSLRAVYQDADTVLTLTGGGELTVGSFGFDQSNTYANISIDAVTTLRTGDLTVGEGETFTTAGEGTYIGGILTVIDDGTTVNLGSNVQLAKLGVTAGNVNISGETSVSGTTDLSNASSSTGVVTVKGTGTLNINGSLWGRSASHLYLEQGGTVNIGSSLTIVGAAAGAELVAGTGDVQYSLDSGDWTIKNADTTITAAENQNITLANAISGNGSLVKLGAGTLTLTAVNTFTGDLLISEGTVKVGNGNKYQALGAYNASRLIEVAAGGTLDVNGNEGGGSNGKGDGYTVTLNGGTLTNTGTAKGSGSRQYVTHLKLSDDSNVVAAQNFGIIGSGYAATSMDMGGHTLTIDGPNTFYVVNATITGGGAIDVHSGTLSFNVAGYNNNLGTFASNFVLSGGTLTGGNDLSLANDIYINTTANSNMSLSVKRQGHAITFKGNANLTETGNLSGVGAIVKEGTGALTLSGTTDVSGTIRLNGGTLNLGGTVAVNTASLGEFEVFDDSSQTYSHGNNGFLTSSGQYYLVKGGENTTASHTGAITGGSYVDNPTKAGKGAGDIIITIDAAESTTYYVNETMATADDAAITSTATDIAIKKGATLTASSSSVTFNNAKLHGEGTYALADTVKAMSSGLSLDTDWAGIVRLTGATQTNINFAQFANGTISTIELKGFTGWATDNLWKGINAQNFMLTNTDNGGAAWTNGAFSQSSADTASYTGKWSGTGTYVTNINANRYLNHTYSGDISDWTGIFDKQGAGTSILTFTGSSDKVNVEIKKTGGTLNVVADANAAFSKAINASEFKVTAGHTATLGANVTLGGLTGAGNIASTANITLNGTGTYVFDGAITDAKVLTKSGNGTQTFNGKVTLSGGRNSITAGTVYFNGGFAYSGGDSYALVTSNNTTVHFGGNSDLSGKNIGPVAGAKIVLDAGATLKLAQLLNSPSNSGANGTLDMKSGSVLTVTGAMRLTGASSEGGTIHLGNNVTVDLHAGSYTPIMEFGMGAVVLDGANATIQTLSNGGTVKLDSISGTGTLTLKANSGFSARNTFSIGGSATESELTKFHGTLALERVGTGANRVLLAEFNDKYSAADAVVQASLTGTHNSEAVGILINSNVVQMKGLKDGSNITNANSYALASGSASALADTPNAGAATYLNSASDGTPRTLEFTGSAASDSYTTAIKVLSGVNLTMSGAGSQTFNGDLSAMNGAVTVNSGTLTLSNSSGTAASLGTIGVTGGNLVLGGKITYTGSAPIANNGTITLNSDLTVTNLAAELDRTFYVNEYGELTFEKQPGFFRGTGLDTLQLTSGTGTVAANDHKAILNGDMYEIYEDGLAMHMQTGEGKGVDYTTYYMEGANFNYLSYIKDGSGGQLRKVVLTATADASNELFVDTLVGEIDLAGDGSGAMPILYMGDASGIGTGTIRTEVSQAAVVGMLSLTSGTTDVGYTHTELHMNPYNTLGATQYIRVDDRVQFTAATTSSEDFVFLTNMHPASSGQTQYKLDDRLFAVAADTVQNIRTEALTEDEHGVGASVGNSLSVRAVHNSYEGGQGALVLTAGVEPTALKEVIATSGDIQFMNMAAANLDTLEIGAGKTVSMYTGSIAEAAQEASVTVSGTLTADAGATLNANLELAAGSTLDVSATGGTGLQLGSTLTINPGMQLSDADLRNVWDLEIGGMYKLVYDVNLLEIKDSTGTVTGTFNPGELTAADKVDAHQFYNKLQENHYYVVFTNDGGNVGTYAIYCNVPEPTTSTLSLLALAALAARRRRK